MVKKAIADHIEGRRQYQLKDGTVVPSVTTVLNLVARPGLVPWAWDLGRQGVDLHRYQQETSAIGRLAHSFALESVGGMKPNLKLYSQFQIEKAKNSLGSWRAWLKNHELKPIMVEQPLVSKTYEYGGTPDYYGLIDGQLGILDLKTGPETYLDQWYQIAGYWGLIHEAKRACKTYQLIRIGRDESEGFDYRVKDSVFYEFNAYLMYLSIYKIQHHIKLGRSGFDKGDLAGMKRGRGK